MRSIVRFVAVLFVFGATSAPVTGSAQEHDQPWTPKKFQRSELIDFGDFEESPLVLPWSVKRIDDLPTHSRIDYKHVLDAPYSDVKKHFDDAYSSQDPAVKLRKALVPQGKKPDLRVLGEADTHEGRTYTLGNKDLRRDFAIRLVEEKGQAILIFKNMTVTQVYGSGVPGLAPFKPIDADPIPIGRDQ